MNTGPLLHMGQVGKMGQVMVSSERTSDSMRSMTSTYTSNSDTLTVTIDDDGITVSVNDQHWTATPTPTGASRGERQIDAIATDLTHWVRAQQDHRIAVMKGADT